jgi:hypothetical protein
VGVQVPGVDVQREPVYVQPRPIYAPAPIRYERHDEGRRYDGPHWQHHGHFGDHEREGFTNGYESAGPRHPWYPSHRYGPNGDFDRDGIPNRFDHAPNNPYRR